MTSKSLTALNGTAFILFFEKQLAYSRSIVMNSKESVSLSKAPLIGTQTVGLLIPWSLLNPFFLSFENEALNLGPAQLEQPPPISKKFDF